MDTLRTLLATTIFLLGLMLLGSVFLSGCAAPAQCVKPVVHLDRPALPTISAAELKPLSDSTYWKLRERDLRLKEAFEQCELIVEGLTE